MNVCATLFRLYRSVLIWFAVALVAVEVIGLAVVANTFGPSKFSFWIVMTGSVAKYWPLVAGIVLIGMQMRQFVANGVTRGEYLRGMALFGLVLATGLAAAVVAGHAVESAVLGLLDGRTATYPVFSVAEAPAEFAHVLPVSLGFFTTGALVSAAFYRFRPWVGVLALIPAALPLGVAQSLVEFDEYGEATSRLPYAVAVTVTLAVTVAGALACYRLMRDAAIRRTAG